MSPTRLLSVTPEKSPGCPPSLLPPARSPALQGATETPARGVCPRASAGAVSLRTLKPPASQTLQIGAYLSPWERPPIPGRFPAACDSDFTQDKQPALVEMLCRVQRPSTPTGLPRAQDWPQRLRQFVLPSPRGTWRSRVQQPAIAVPQTPRACAPARPPSSTLVCWTNISVTASLWQPRGCFSQGTPRFC